MGTRNAPAPSATRERLLATAGRIFAEGGFRAATIRGISAAAGANVAAVYYYFGDKERLYAAALREAYESALRKYPPDLGVGPEAPAEERLRAFIRSFLLRLLDEERPAWHGKLIALGMLEPRPGIHALLEETVLPLFRRLQEILAEILGPRHDLRRVRLCAASVVGQCLVHRHTRLPLFRLGGQEDAFGVEELVEHVASFTLQALSGLARTNPHPLQAPGRSLREKELP